MKHIPLTVFPISAEDNILPVAKAKNLGVILMLFFVPRPTEFDHFLTPSSLLPSSKPPWFLNQTVVIALVHMVSLFHGLDIYSPDDENVSYFTLSLLWMVPFLLRSPFINALSSQKASTLLLALLNPLVLKSVRNRGNRMYWVMSS